MILSDTINNILKTYHSLSLENAERVKLMNRIDTKYIITIDDVFSLLNALRQNYHVLEISSQRTGTYTSIYYDTSDRKMFYSHVTGRLPRYKVRERTYSQNGQKFFEVKQKDNKRRTFKQRISILENSSEVNDWLPQQAPFNSEDLSPVLVNSFERITLINNEHTERVTVDFNIQFSAPTGAVTPIYDRIAIVELKQNKTAESFVRKYLRSNGVHPKSVSKFCMGLLLLFGNETGYKRYKKYFSQFIKSQNEQNA